MLDEVLEVGKISRNIKGIGFDHKPTNKKDKNISKIFAPLENKTKF